ncbi:hypothetical protein HO173_001935 [Letharia columbiana]|uniref:Uncharacterized protein n=1 Tax=Letharia columbiana TaxID=112416 RepID=A0A8H6G4C5_9LECA|nr:uncharacterized protein HO173_001935 [Letharia columbiana]KAF6240324.1 hypothetical protein HO173_001935 [Letharia columbiana]
MQIASILSDLTSLRVCDHSAALALVSVHRAGRVDDDRKLSVKAKEDVDMQRAIDLVELHYGVKMKHLQGEEGLRQGRREVDMVLEKLEGDSLKDKRSRG